MNPSERTGPASFYQELRWAGAFQDALLTSNAVIVQELPSAQFGLPLMELIINRHEVLRTSLQFSAGEVTQVVRATADYPYVEMDLDGVDEVGSYFEAERARRLGIDEGSLLSSATLGVSRNMPFVALTIDHAAWDASTVEILKAEFRRGLQGLIEKKDPDPFPAPQYLEVATSERQWFEQHRDAAQEFWKSYMKGAPVATRMALVSSSEPPDALVGGAFRILPTGVSTALMARCRDLRITPNMALLSAVVATVALVVETPDVIIRTSVGNRTTDAARSIVGCLARPLCLRTEVHGTDQLSAVAKNLRKSYLSALEFQSVPSSVMVGSVASRSGGACVPFDYTAFGQTLQLNGTPSIPRVGRLEPRVKPASSDRRDSAGVSPLYPVVINWSVDSRGAILCDLTCHGEATLVRDLESSLFTVTRELAVRPERTVEGLTDSTSRRLREVNSVRSGAVVNGFRAELSAVTRTLEGHPSVRAATCSIGVSTDRLHDHIVATVVPERDSDPPQELELRSWVRDRLRTTCVLPERIVVVPQDSVRDGSVMSLAVAPPPASSSGKKTPGADATESEMSLLLLVRDALGIDGCDLDDDLLDRVCGFPALLLPLLRAGAEAGLPIAMGDIIRARTVRGLAAGV